MSEKHTPGRLAANPIQPNQIATADAKQEIACVTVLSNPHETVANARRLVACWNACEGISTEALELGAIQDRIASACGELYEVKRQRDELLAELKKARAYIAEHQASFVETVTNQSTGLIDDAEDLMAVEADQDLLNGIDEAIAKAAA